jgi:hypothetical protein
MSVKYPELPEGYYWWVGRQHDYPLEPHIKLMKKGRWKWLDSTIDSRKPIHMSVLFPSWTLEEYVQEAINGMYDEFMSTREREEEWNSFEPPGRS